MHFDLWAVWMALLTFIKLENREIKEIICLRSVTIILPTTRWRTLATFVGSLVWCRNLLGETFSIQNLLTIIIIIILMNTFEAFMLPGSWNTCLLPNLNDSQNSQKQNKSTSIDQFCALAICHLQASTNTKGRSQVSSGNLYSTIAKNNPKAT